MNETTSCVSWNDNSNDWIASDSKSGDSNDKSVTSQRRGLSLNHDDDIDYSDGED